MHDCLKHTVIHYYLDNDNYHNNLFYLNYRIALVINECIYDKSLLWLQKKIFVILDSQMTPGIFSGHNLSSSFIFTTVHTLKI